MTGLVKREPSPCSAQGRLISKSGCYALRRDDGSEAWLEMDSIPLHLVDSLVYVSGTLFPSDLIEVNMIGPARRA
jgi:hypothetical protein